MATEAGDVLFVSKLNAKSKEKARMELHELNDKDRLIAVQTFRKWVMEQDWLKTPTDFEFLLRFLRTRKFSQLGARQTLENYWTCKTNMPQFHRGIDPADTNFQQVLKYGFVFGHKKVDAEGRRILFARPGCFTHDQMKEIGIPTLYKVFSLVCEWCMFDENSQANGLICVIDYTGMGMQQYIAYTNYEEQKNISKFLQKSLPLRLKSVNFYNEPTFFDLLMTFFSQFMSDKLKQRMNVVGKNLVDLYKVVDRSLLPTEYLPDEHEGPSAGPMDTVIDDMIEDMTKTNFYAYIRDVSSSKYGVDKNKRTDMEREPAASFRKLNVD